MIDELIREALAKRITGRAAEVSFYGMLSLFPALLILAGAVGPLEVLIGHDLALRAEAAVIDFMDLVLTERATGVVDAVRELFNRKSGGLLTTAAILGFWTLSSAFSSVIVALDVSYGVVERRSWIRIRLTALGLALGNILTLAIILIVIVLRPLLGRFLADRFGLDSVFSFFWDWRGAPIAFATIVLWTTTLYHVAPNRRAPWRRDLPGGIMAAVLWLVVSYGLNLYLRLAAGFNQVLGILGGGLILMIWVYLLSLVILFGGELNGLLSRRRAIHKDPER